MAEPAIRVEVVYATVDHQLLLEVELPAGSTISEAIVASGVGAQFPHEDLSAHPVGIFGRVVDDPSRHVLEQGDRVEIYRPLLVDPKEVRRLRAAEAARARKAR